MVSRYMVLFGITYLRLDIFITWWMSIFQSTIVLRHFISLFVHYHILGHTPFSESTRPFSRLSFTFWSSCWPLRVAYWGIPSFIGIIGPFISFTSLWVVILRHISSGQVWLHCHLSYPLALGHLIRSSSEQFHVNLSFWNRTYIDQSSSVSVWVFGTAPISIDHLPFQFELMFSGQHLYWSVIVLSVWVYIFWVAPISIGHLPINLSFLRPHLYQSVIVMLVWVWVFGIAPI